MRFKKLIFIIVLGLGLEGVGFGEEQVLAVLKGSDPTGVRPRQALPEVGTYEQLLSAIRKVRKESRERIEEAVARENVREAWETGKLIDVHVLHHQQRADYGKQVILRLARDLESSQTELRYMLEFARTYPIYPTSGELTWSDYRELLALNDRRKRNELAKQAERENWDVKRIRQEVKRINASLKTGTNMEIPEILEAKPGRIGTYRIVTAATGPYQGQKVADLGFSNYHKPKGKLKFEEGEIVLEKNGRMKKLKDATQDSLFTYQAYVIKILDGDSFSALIDLGFGFTTVQTLRLRGLDAPEIESAEGKEAKEWLDSRLKHSGMTEDDVIRPILIRTVKSDKYDRYLVDVWSGGVYVNQELVANGFATVVSE